MTVLPGQTIGVLGGGQLGRMLALAARALGYRIHVLDPHAECAAKPIVERCITASFDDAEAAANLAKQCQIVTLEIEKIGAAALAAAERHAPVRPSAHILTMVQNRGLQKQWLQSNGFPVAPWRLATTAQDLCDAYATLGEGAFIKTVHGGYDGRGQNRLRRGDDYAALWNKLGATTCVVEKAVDLAQEISVLVARRPQGECAVYPPALNHHENHILTWSVLPAPVSAAITTAAQQLALDLATALAVEGLLVVEMFITKSGDLLVNELAPRPHNSYHESEVACVTSQFEQAVRAVCDLPLGSTEVTRPAAIYNLLGDLWQPNRAPNFESALAINSVSLRLYGKGDPRPARKMGHLVASASTAEVALERALAAYAALRT